MPIAKSTEKFLAEIYGDGKITPGEYIAARNLADEKCQAVEAELGGNNDFTAFQKSCDVTVQLMQNIAVGLKDEDITDLGRAKILDALQAQFGYLKASVDLIGGAIL